MSAGRQRFSIIPAMAVTDARLEPRDLQVLCLLGRHTDDLGWCCRSQVKMARELECGRATVQRALSRLVGAGYLEHRSKQRESGGDAAHDYRVVIDPPSTAARSTKTKRGGAHLWAGVPTGGQGCPPMDGQGVPTHERAPMLTTPINEPERGAREAEFEKAYRAWPTSPTDSRPDALKAWNDLDDDERREAVDEAARCVASFKAIGRKHVCSFASYLRDKRWLGLPPRPVPVAKVARAEELPRKPTRFEQRLAAGGVDQDAIRRKAAELKARYAEGAPP
jgi:hypothetical protein